MSPEVAGYAQVAIITTGFVAALCAVGVVTVRALIHTVRKKQSALPPGDRSMEQLQRSVDAIALEVERIAEAQRFTTRLLSDREKSQSIPS